jgi:hypothetical protein
LGCKLSRRGRTESDHLELTVVVLGAKSIKCIGRALHYVVSFAVLGRFFFCATGDKKVTVQSLDVIS